MLDKQVAMAFLQLDKAIQDAEEAMQAAYDGEDIGYAYYCTMNRAVLSIDMETARRCAQQILLGEPQSNHGECMRWLREHGFEANPERKTGFPEDMALPKGKLYCE